MTDIKHFRDDYESLILQSNEIDKKDSLSSHPIFKENPFRSAFLQHFSDNKGKKMQFITKRADDVFDGNGDPISDGNESLIVGTTHIIDSASFTKVYHESLKLFGLSAGASKLFFYIATKLTQNSLTIELDADQLCDDMGISKPTYYRAIKDLLTHSVLAKTKRPYLYFINPVFLFNGDRIKVVNDYIKEGSVSANTLSKNANIRQIGRSRNEKTMDGINPDGINPDGINNDTSKNQPDNSEAESQDEFGV